MYQILVVDDERIERNGIKMLLRHMQLLCEITEAANGRDALEYLKGHTADVLLTDVKMPFMDGIQLIEECKKENINEDMKCIIFSGCSEFDYARKAVRLGVSDYILKPVDPSEFKETITRVIQELEAERAEKNMKKKSLFLVPMTTMAIIASILGGKAIDAKAQDTQVKEDFVIVLDPGHDAAHVGSRGYGLKEEELNMKIALACKAQLEQYDGIKVYLTHNTLACPYPGSSSRECLYARPDYAKSLGASLYVSLHNNAGSDTSGHEVYYPNDHYVPQFNAQGYNLAQLISNNLTQLGIIDRGVFTRDSDSVDLDDENNWYPDGSRADYYAVIRGSKKNGFVGIIVEHAYISNQHDALLLSNNEVLNKMGIADANGIAQYYNLSKKNGLKLSSDGNWYMYSDGLVNTDFNGMAENEYGWWKITNGTVDFSYNGLDYNEYGWWKFNNGTVDFSYNGMTENEYGWWKFNNGTVDFSYNGMAENEYGWWKFTDGILDLSYDGMAENEYGWWKFTNGLLDFNYNGIAKNEYGYWKFTNGTIDFDLNEMIYDDEYGWVKVTNGLVDLEYNGIAQNEYGYWKFTDGKLDFDYNGEYTWENDTYTVVNGYAVKKSTQKDNSDNKSDNVDIKTNQLENIQ